jgi:hypothetical protein
MPMQIAFTSAMMTAARYAPVIDPMPPTTTTTKASPIATKSVARLAGSRATCSAPPRPASAAPSAKTLVNSTAWLTPRAPTISRSCVAARTSRPKRVRASAKCSTSRTNGPITIRNRS